MKKYTLAFLLLTALSFLLVSCPSDGNTNGNNKNDGTIIASGTKISDFSGHANSLDWFIGTFIEDGGEDYPNDKWTITDTTIKKEFANPMPGFDSNEYGISEITYNSVQTLVESYNAPAGTWTFKLLSQDEEDVEPQTTIFIIEKADEDSFYPTVSTLERRGTIKRIRQK
ncbi:MAG TPA: hypothetical protein DCO86_01155 [Spirochaetaceae bacterium]|nr:hypothetical protein [Spirochaetaceae bacterium]